MSTTCYACASNLCYLSELTVKLLATRRTWGGHAADPVEGRGWRVSGHAVDASRRSLSLQRMAAAQSATWTSGYLRQVGIADLCCGFAAGLVAYQARFGALITPPIGYIGLSLALPVVWLLILVLAGAYDPRFIGVGSEEFRKVFNAAFFLTAAVALVSYAAKLDLSRSYVFVALPSLAVLDLLARYALRKHLHRIRRRGGCMNRVVLVGYAPVVADMTAVLRRNSHHGLATVAACVTDDSAPNVIAGVPAFTGLDRVADVVGEFGADTVAVLACPEMSGQALRRLAWSLEKTGTQLCVAPALLDVAGPRTTIRPVAGLPLLHMDHPEFSGARRVIKEAFDKLVALVALTFALPLIALISTMIWLDDRGPAFFRQTRVGKNGRPFSVYKFRTMIRDAEARKTELAGLNQHDGPLFKMRQDPRVTRVGAWLRRWSLDELPQLLNVLAGDMSLVGPRPALPEEAAVYGDFVRRRLAVKPGITGLWQVSGRADLPWEEAVRLDLRYVENWSLMLDLQILWKTWAAVVHGWGAY